MFYHKYFLNIATRGESNINSWNGGGEKWETKLQIYGGSGTSSNFFIFYFLDLCENTKQVVKKNLEYFLRK